jgi:hypothetical protein
MYKTYTVTGVGSTITGSDLKANEYDVKLNLIMTAINSASTWEWVTVANIPSGLAPAITLQKHILFYNSATGNYKIGSVRLTLLGEVQIYSTESVSGLGMGIAFEYVRK